MYYDPRMGEGRWPNTVAADRALTNRAGRAIIKKELYSSETKKTVTGRYEGTWDYTTITALPLPAPEGLANALIGIELPPHNSCRVAIPAALEIGPFGPEKKISSLVYYREEYDYVLACIPERESMFLARRIGIMRDIIYGLIQLRKLGWAIPKIAPEDVLVNFQGIAHVAGHEKAVPHVEVTEEEQASYLMEIFAGLLDVEGITKSLQAELQGFLDSLSAPETNTGGKLQALKKWLTVFMINNPRLRHSLPNAQETSLNLTLKDGRSVHIMDCPLDLALWAVDNYTFGKLTVSGYSEYDSGNKEVVETYEDFEESVTEGGRWRELYECLLEYFEDQDRKQQEENEETEPNED